MDGQVPVYSYPMHPGWIRLPPPPQPWLLCILHSTGGCGAVVVRLRDGLVLICLLLPTEKCLADPPITISSQPLSPEEA